MSRHHIVGQPATPKLNRQEVETLINILRVNFLYQTPVHGRRDKKPVVQLKMIDAHYHKLMYLIEKAGGWEIPEEMKTAIPDRKPSLWERVKHATRHIRKRDAAQGD